MPRIGPPGRPAAAPAQRRGLGAAAETDPDVRLMLRAQEGDEAAFPELFQRLGPRVLQYVRRLVGSEARAEEITQDVFVQMFRFRQRYRPESKLSTWVFTIATNLCLNELRRPERQLRVDLWEPRRRGGRPAREPGAARSGRHRPGARGRRAGAGPGARDGGRGAAPEAAGRPAPVADRWNGVPGRRRRTGDHRGGGQGAAVSRHPWTTRQVARFP